MNILARLLGRTENKTVSNNLTVVWGLPDPYLSDWNEALKTIHALSANENAFDLTTRVETYEKLSREVKNASFSRPAKVGEGLVNFVVARNSRELDIALAQQ
jgi:hypothetical protein